ncbi:MULTISPECIES: hypothetical protein [Serratia]|uniref:hypothetical protein n=1 Tax=Serratia TaxID=613 RepID=UPI001AA13EDA|nr:hypothetical protein [Serratia marcescens]
MVNNGRNITLVWSLDPAFPPVPVSTLKALAPVLGINKTQFIRTYWAAHDADLFEALLRYGTINQPKPEVFSIDDLYHPDPRLVSVMMPFSPSFSGVYHAIAETAGNMGLRCHRADDIWNHNAIIQDVVSLICQSSIVICDLSDRNPNVF